MCEFMGIEAHICKNHDEWLDFRNKGVGGSDVAGIFGASSWSTPLSVWQEKVGLTQPKDLSDNESIEWGTRNEASIREKFADMHPDMKVMQVLDKNGDSLTLVAKNRPWAHANLDGVVIDSKGEPGILECKTVDKDNRKAWSSGVPDYYLYQVVHYFSVTGWKYAYVAALIGGNRYVEYRIERDEEDVITVSSMVDEFWNSFVVPKVPPMVTGSVIDTQALADQYKGGEGELPMDTQTMTKMDDAASAYLEAKARKDQAEMDMNEAANRMRAMMGDHEFANTDVFRVSWKPSTTKRMDTKALKAAYPDLYESFCKESTSRRLLVKEGDKR